MACSFPFLTFHSSFNQSNGFGRFVTCIVMASGRRVVWGFSPSRKCVRCPVLAASELYYLLARWGWVGNPDRIGAGSLWRVCCFGRARCWRALFSNPLFLDFTGIYMYVAGVCEGGGA